jgi:ubiquinone/menaquinone biosynthesis C-methylase UbiE
VLTRLAHCIASHPRTYDLIQRAAGVSTVHARLAEVIGRINPHGVMLDVGGGTGINSFLWLGRGRYICLDLDALKLRGYRDKHPLGAGIQADATRLPFADGSADVLLCKFLVHHLNDEAAARLMDEAHRVLRSDGHLIVIDPVWNPSRRVARLLWKYDRGAFPRPADAIAQIVSRRFALREREQVYVWHEYVLCIATP